MFEEKQKYLTELAEIDDQMPLFKNSSIYESSDWREFNDCDTFPVQRKLTLRECVFDLDHVAPLHFEVIPRFLQEMGLKHVAWKSGDEGMHIHFWTNIGGKEQKKVLVKMMSEKIEQMFGVRNDLGPMGHGVIRTEWSMHPTKGYQKTFLSSNISPLFCINELDVSTRQKVFDMSSTDTQMEAKSGERNGEIPSCVKYMLSHKFSDGRERMLFCLVSWFKGSGLDDQVVFDRCWNWCREQGYGVSPRTIWAKIKSSRANVGCTYRHQLLEDLGVDIGHCKWEK